MRTTIKAKLIKMNVLIILPMLILIVLFTVFTIDRYQLLNVKKTLLNDSYILQVYLNQYLSRNKKEVLSEKELYFLNQDLSIVVKLRSQIFYSLGEIFIDSYQEVSEKERNKFRNDPGIQLAAENKKNYWIKKENRQRVFLISFPIYCDHDLVGVMRLTYPLAAEDVFRNRLLIVLSIVGLIVLLILGLLLSFFTGQIVTPLTKLRLAVQSFADDQLTDDLKINSGDEVEELALSFNNMATKLNELIENLKTEQNKQKDFFNHMTHEFRTPLTTIIGYADLLKRLDSDEEQEECFKYIRSESKRLLRMVEDILRHSKLRTYTLKLDKRMCALDHLLRESVEIMRYKADKYGIELSLYSRDSVILEIDRDKVKQVVLNIIDNAINHSKTEKVEIHLYQQTKKIVVAIRDYGQGISPDWLARIRERFSGLNLEAVNTQSGHGFGLPISEKIMELHGGRLLIRTSECGGTTVFICFNLE